MEINLYIATTDDGKWLAATEASPYFCFEGDSEAEVVGLARSAIALFSSNIDVIRAERERANTVPVVHETRKELLCA